MKPEDQHDAQAKDHPDDGPDVELAPAKELDDLLEDFASSKALQPPLPDPESELAEEEIG